MKNIVMKISSFCVSIYIYHSKLRSKCGTSYNIRIYKYILYTHDTVNIRERIYTYKTEIE